MFDVWLINFSETAEIIFSWYIVKVYPKFPSGRKCRKPNMFYKGLGHLLMVKTTVLCSDIGTGVSGITCIWHITEILL